MAAAAAPVASYVVPAVASVLGGAMSGKGGKSGPAQLPRGMGGLAQQITGLGNAATAGMGTAGGAGTFGGFQGGKGTSGVNNLMGQVNTGTGTVGEGFNAGVAGLREGASSGFLPDIMSAVEGHMLPGLERAFDRGAAGLRDQAALTGNLNSSGTFRDISDFRGGLEANMGNQIASIYGSAVPGAIGARTSSAGALAGLPGNLNQGLFGDAANRELSSSQFDRQLPLQGLATAFAGAGQAPYHARGGKGGGGGGGGKGGGK